MMDTLFFGKSKLTIDDSWLYPNQRELEFGNFIQTRKLWLDYSVNDHHSEEDLPR